jgi:hypothetical protein
MEVMWHDLLPEGFREKFGVWFCGVCLCTVCVCVCVCVCVLVFVFVFVFVFVVESILFV